MEKYNEPTFVGGILPFSKDAREAEGWGGLIATKFYKLRSGEKVGESGTGRDREENSGR